MFKAPIGLYLTNIFNIEHHFFRVIAIDPHTNKSSVVQVKLTLCTGCSGHGNCTNGTRDRGQGNHPHFQYARCICEDQYEGT